MTRATALNLTGRERVTARPQAGPASKQLARDTTKDNQLYSQDNTQATIDCKTLTKTKCIHELQLSERPTSTLRLTPSQQLSDPFKAYSPEPLDILRSPDTHIPARPILSPTNANPATIKPQ